MNWIRKIRQRQRFTRAFQRQARELHAAGEIDDAKLAECMAASNDYKVMDQAVAEIEIGEGMWGEFSWAKLWEWIKANWMEIAKLILSLVVMFAEEGPEGGERRLSAIRERVKARKKAPDA